MPNQTAVQSDPVAKAVAFFVRHGTRLVNVRKNKNPKLQELAKLVRESNLHLDVITQELPTFEDYLQTVEPRKRTAYRMGMSYFQQKDHI